MHRSNVSLIARGLGTGLGHVLYYLNDNEELQNKIFGEIDKNKIFAKSLAASLYNFSSVKDRRLIQKVLSKSCQKLDYENGFSFNDYPTIGLPNNTYYYCTNKEDEIADHNVINDEMKEYLQMVIDEMKNKSNNDRINNL